jgi:hypothetical protein
VWVFGYIAACGAIVAFAVGVFGPRTGDVALEDIQDAATTPDQTAASPDKAH